MTIFVDGPMLSPRCGCGSQEFEESPGQGWAIVKFQEVNGELQVTQHLPVRIKVCRGCLALTFLAVIAPSRSP